MTLPANIRVNLSAPFPSLVKGSGPVTLAKSNGIWTVGFNPALLGIQHPLPAELFHDFIIVHDSVAGNNFTMALSDIVAAVTPVAGSLVQRLINAGPATVLPTDRILNFDCNAPTTITLPGFAAQAGVPLTFKDVAGKATATNITIAAAGGEFIDGQATILLDTNYESITLVPAFDGVTTGWLQI